MNTREFFLARWEDESPTFLKVFRALRDQHDFRPHPRSRSTSELVWLLVLEVQALLDWASGKDVDWKETPPPKTMDEIIAAYEKAQVELRPRLTALDDPAWERPVKLVVVGGSTYEYPLGDMFGSLCSTPSTTAASSACISALRAAKYQAFTGRRRTTRPTSQVARNAASRVYSCLAGS